MINSVNNKNNQTNFKALIPIKMIMVGEDITRDEKQCKSALNNFRTILLKKDKVEIKTLKAQNFDIRNLNDFIRTAFKSKILDYSIPQRYHISGEFHGQNIKFLRDYRSGDYVMLTGKDADTIEAANSPIKLINGKFKRAMENTQDKKEKENLRMIRENELQQARHYYGGIARQLLEKINYDAPKLMLQGKKEKSGKITPINIGFC